MSTYLRSQFCYWCEKHRYNLKQEGAGGRISEYSSKNYQKTLTVSQYLHVLQVDYCIDKGWKSDYKFVLYWCHREYVETRREIPVKNKSCSFKNYFVIFGIIKWSNIKKALPFLLLMPPCQSVTMSNAWKKTLVEISFSFLYTNLEPFESWYITTLLIQLQVYQDTIIKWFLNFPLARPVH